MDVVVKVIIDEKEYDRLLDIERRYKAATNQNQSGAGNSCHCTEKKDMPLSEIVARNAEKHAVDTPIADVLPSITDVAATETVGSVSKEEEHKKSGTDQGTGSASSQHTFEELGVAKFIYPWYFIGAPHPH